MTSDDIAQRLATYRPFRRLIAEVGPPPARRASRVDSRFESVARAIVYQQLAGKAAAAIFGRVRDAVGSDFTADQIAAISPDTASACGLSRAKYEALLDLATRTQNGHVRFHQHGRMTDEQVLAELVQVRGIGPWTAQMYLMNNLARPDVWPHLDYGVRNGWSLLHGYPDMISIKELATAADHLTPFRSSVAWYCWRAVDLAREQGR